MLIDLGGNLLPGFAGGMADVRACAGRLSALYSAGIAAAVLTPLYYPAKRSVEEFVDYRQKVLHNLSYNMPENSPALYLGCEVYIDERLKYISSIGELAIWGTHTMLAYMPEGTWEGALIDTLEAIRAAGIDVLLTHIDRYPEKYAEDLFRYGYRAILDASAFWGMSNLRRRKKFLSWIDEGYVVGIGGNFNADEKRIGDIIAKVTDILGDERAAKLGEASARVLSGAVQITN